MSTRSIAVLVACFSLAGLFLVQRGTANQAEKIPNEHGRFAVAPGHETTVLLDTATGKTWTLHSGIGTSGVRVHTWLPNDRVEDPEKVGEWHAVQQRREQEYLERQREVESKREYQRRQERERQLKAQRGMQ